MSGVVRKLYDLLPIEGEKNSRVLDYVSWKGDETF